jgi:uncharacterized protein with HEPN domain
VKDPAPYLRHILDAIAAIEEYTTEGREAFLKDRKTRDAVIRNLEIIGEATRNISPAFQAAHLDIPWRQAAELRNVLIHEYFGVDVRIVWGVVEIELPTLKAKIQKALDQITGS